MLHKVGAYSAFVVLLLNAAACQRPLQATDATVWEKIKLDFKRLDEQGLAGPANGKVAVQYEFCIPAEARYRRAVQKIDRTVQQNGGKGRIGCSDQEWLMIGSTHQARYKRVLYELASLPYVRRIEETFWE